MDVCAYEASPSPLMGEGDVVPAARPVYPLAGEQAAPPPKEASSVVIPTIAEGSDRCSMVNRVILNQVQNYSDATHSLAPSLGKGRRMICHRNTS